MTNKLVMLGKIIVYIIIFIVVLGLIGYLMTPDLTEEPSKIAVFEVSGLPEYDDYYQVCFGLQNNKSEWISASGIAKIEILDDNGIVLYSEERNIKESDFGLYRFIYTGGEFLGVCWDIPVSNVKPGAGDLYGLGEAVLTFTTDSGKTLYKKTDVAIPLR